MHSIEQLSEGFVLKFESQESWRGVYSQAKLENRFRYETDECPICMNKYLPEARLIILPCAHLFHEHCFALWDKQNCPLDQTLATGIKKVSLLGKSLIFSPKTGDLATWLFKPENRWSGSMVLFLQKNRESFLQVLSEMENPNDFAEHFVGLMQDCLDAYDGKISMQRILQESQERFANFLRICEQNKSFLQKLIPFSDDENPRVSERILNLQIPAVAAYIEICAVLFGAPPVEREGVERFLTYIRNFVELGTQHPDFPGLCKKSDQNFYLKHVGALRKLDSIISKYNYLFQLEMEDFSRLKKISQDYKGPTSQFICNVSPHIEQLHDMSANRLAVVAAISIFLGTCMFIYRQ